MRTLVLSLVACLIPAVAGCHKPDEAAAATPPKEAAQPLHVTTTAVVDKPIPELLTLTGTLRANLEVDVAADVSGKIVAVYVDRGQAVKRGQIMATVDSRVAAFAASAAEANSKVAQSQLDEARRDCDRVKHLLDTGAISQADYDRQTASCTAQQWSAAAAEAQQRSALKLAGDSSIRAPSDGFVGESYVNLGMYVQPQTRVASLYNSDPIRLMVTVPEINVAAITPDMPMRFTVAAYGDQSFTGNVKYISPNVREASRDLVVEAVVPNADSKLKPGMFAVASIDLGAKPHPVVPKTSVIQDDTGARLFVVVGSLIQERLVQLGLTSGDVVAVQQGVKVGDNVVNTPGPEVRDGARVE